MLFSRISDTKPQTKPVSGFWSVWLAALCLVLSASSVQADDKGWVLTQKSATIGDQYLYISPSGLKCVNPRAGFAMVSAAPDWNIVMFNDKTRCYYSTTLDNYKRTLAQRGLTSDLANRQWARGQTGAIGGMKATQFVMHGGGAVTRIGSNGKAKTSTVSAANYWVSDEITVPARLGDLLSSAYGLPTTQYVPLRLDYTDSKGPKRMLETYRMQATAIPSNYFQCPGGYKLVQSDAEVMMNDEQKQMIEDMSREMGGGLESPSTPAPAQYSPAPAAAPKQPAAATAGGGDALSKLLDAYKKAQHK